MQQQPRASGRHQGAGEVAHQQHASLTMQPLPSLGGPQRPYGSVQDWSQALTNMQDAKLAVQNLRALVHDAVYLDEEAYRSAVSQTQQQSVLQVGHEFTRLARRSAKGAGARWSRKQALALS